MLLQLVPKHVERLAVACGGEAASGAASGTALPRASCSMHTGRARRNCAYPWARR